MSITAILEQDRQERRTYRRIKQARRKQLHALADQVYLAVHWKQHATAKRLLADMRAIVRQASCG